MKFQFEPAPQDRFKDMSSLENWDDWTWQVKNSLKTLSEFRKYFKLTEQEEKAFHQQGEKQLFNIRTTPYYAALASSDNSADPIRKILMPSDFELNQGAQSQLDPLGEKKKINNPVQRVIHRYSDRALFLTTDMCSVYCRYCTRKHFTGHDQAFIKKEEYDQAMSYFRKTKGLREIILSGGDPLTNSDEKMEMILSDLRSIDHIEIIRIGSRMPVVAPMRITEKLVRIIKKYKPVFLMTHFNHPRELTAEAAAALELCVDNGIPVMNQMVLLNGVNNHPAIVQALSRRLLYLRVKPYYMFQCDPSIGTDHLRTSIDDSLNIQKELWGHLSGLAMPQLSVDIPNGGGKAYYVPSFETKSNLSRRQYKGWDGVTSEYINPDQIQTLKPLDVDLYLPEWEELKQTKT